MIALCVIAKSYGETTGRLEILNKCVLLQSPFMLVFKT